MNTESNLPLSEDEICRIFSEEVALKENHLHLAEQIVASITLDCDPDIVVETDKSEELHGLHDDKNEDIRSVLLKATLPQKIKLALLGNGTCRTLLIRDSNKMIQQLVLKNPRLQPAEVEEFAKNPNLSELVLRNIAEDTQWMRSYSLKLSIVFNPKTPQALSLKWLRFLNVSDIRRLAKSKNVPNVLCVAARKKLADMEPK